MWLVISDIHIGDKHADKFLPKLFETLKKYSFSDFSIILNGDIFDFAKNMIVDERHRKFISILRGFNKVIYIEGNHDWFVSGLSDVVPGIIFKQQHELRINDKLIKIIHGDQADRFVTWAPKINRFFVRINSWLHEKLGIDVQHIARRTKLVRWFLNRQESKLIKMMRPVDVLIAGHTHMPSLRKEGGVIYCNTGDWVESGHGACAIIDNEGNVKLEKV